MRRDKLLEIAFDKFVEKGYNTTLSEIAQGAGIKKQSIYNHFKDKDELLFETIKIELQNFYSSKASELDSYVNLNAKESLTAIFYSICNYFKDINKIKFWRWILLIDSKPLFTRCRDLMREHEAVFYKRVKSLLESEMQKSAVTEEGLLMSMQTFIVMVHGVLDYMLLYHDVTDTQLLIENTWNCYLKKIENIMGQEVIYEIKN